MARRLADFHDVLPTGFLQNNWKVNNKEKFNKFCSSSKFQSADLSCSYEDSNKGRLFWVKKGGHFHLNTKGNAFMFTDDSKNHCQCYLEGSSKDKVQLQSCENTDSGPPVKRLGCEPDALNKKLANEMLKLCAEEPKETCLKPTKL